MRGQRQHEPAAKYTEMCASSLCGFSIFHLNMGYASLLATNVIKDKENMDDSMRKQNKQAGMKGELHSSL